MSIGATAMSERPLAKHSVTIAGHRTSLSLEPEFWEALKDLCRRDGQSLAERIAEIDEGRAGRNLSSAVRVHVLAEALKPRR
jgi:predicted DNA-binding ribbon-helix-helix protein